MRTLITMLVCSTVGFAVMACEQGTSVAAQVPEDGETTSSNPEGEGPGQSAEATAPPRNPETHDVYPQPEGESREGVSGSGDSSESDDDSGLTGVVNLNDASLEALQKLPGIGPVTADRIEAYRNKRQFEEADDIKRIDGVGDVTFRKLQPYLAVDGETTLADNSSDEE